MTTIVFSLSYPSLPPQLTLEAALTQYHKALQRWEEERKKEREEFTITEKSCVRRPRHPGSPNIRQDNSRSVTLSLKNKTYID